ncbi:MAG: ABC transporter ATP-binding protein, partial [Caldilineaceae bacterium]|nr:ABC transporter ATP-binding protein [Caldilineaceae bacterium]
YPHQISGGQRQRVVIAAALACKPALMILDEPTTALDTTTEMQVLKLVKDLRQNIDTAIVYITHDLTLTNYMCDRVLVMHDGQVVEDGPANTIFERPRKEYTRQLVAAIPRVDGARIRKTPRIPGTDAPILEVRDLSFAYAPQFSLARLFGTIEPPLAVKNVSFEIRKGETLGLVGESGSGKSTVANLLAGLQPPHRGGAYFAGHLLEPRAEKRTLEHLRRVQLIFQDPLSSLNPRQRIGTILTGSLMGFHGLNRREAQERAVALLEDLELPASFMNRYPRQLSGGQQQRVAIARAFAAEPDLIICDEVTSALDVSVQAQIVNLLLDLQAELGLAYLFVAHDLSVVKHVSDRVAVMYVGKIVEIAETSALFSQPRHPYTEALLSAVPKPDPRLRSQRIILEGEVADPAHPPSGCYFHPRCRYAVDRCKTESPELNEIEPGHFVSCHRANEIELVGVS